MGLVPGSAGVGWGLFACSLASEGHFSGINSGLGVVPGMKQGSRQTRLLSCPSGGETDRPSLWGGRGDHSLTLSWVVLEGLLEEEPFLGDLKGEVRSGSRCWGAGDLVRSAPNTRWWVLPTVPPQLLVAEGLGQVTALLGQPLELPCQASGSPAPTLQCVWGGGGQRRGGGRQSACWGVCGDGRPFPFSGVRSRPPSQGGPGQPDLPGLRLTCPHPP